MMSLGNINFFPDIRTDVMSLYRDMAGLYGTTLYIALTLSQGNNVPCSTTGIVGGTYIKIVCGAKIVLKLCYIWDAC